MDLINEISVFKNNISIFLLLVTGSSKAGLILSTNNHFQDSGATTIDLTSSLEWLDLTETTNLSLSEVNNLLSNDTLLQGNTDWRYATDIEFEELIFNWFGTIFNRPNISNISVQLGQVDHPLVELFISTFGDMICNRGPSTISSLNCSYATYGYLKDSNKATNTIYHAYVWDDEGVGFDSEDIAAYTSSLSLGKDNNIGSWLIRKKTDSAFPVSEPSTFVIFSLGMFGLISHRFKKKP